MNAEEIGERLKQGDPEVLAHIWEQFGDALRRRARTRLRQMGIAGQTESMDICNAVLVDLARKGTISLHNPKQIGGYVLRAIDNQVLDVFRELSRQRRDFRRVDAQPVEEFSVAASSTTASVEMLRVEILNQVRAEIGPNHQALIDLVVSNYSWQEIGDRLGMAPDTARMQLRRAVDRVRSRLQCESDACEVKVL